MSEHLQVRRGPQGPVALTTPHALDDFIAEAGRARRLLLRQVPEAFTRDEWAYLMSSLDPAWLEAQVSAVFGPRAEPGDSPAWLASPRRRVAVWLPANVSLLGPLTMLAIAATGCQLRMKASTRAEDLSSAFLDELRRKTPAFAACFEQVQIARFDREDPRNAAMAGEADVRIVFGSDATARQVHTLAHPLESVALSFVDRRSEAWIEPDAVSDQTVRELVQVFAIYGQAGCTSPSRVVLLGADRAQALAFQQRLLQAWPEFVRRDVPMHTASDNVRLQQLARANGWHAVLAARHRAVVAVGGSELPRIDSGMALWIVPADLQTAAATLPRNIQTLGHAVHDPMAPQWRALAAKHGLRRWVPLRRMHHFGWTWDGEEFWRHLFRWTEFAA
ncbi:MAG: acyl-CoA reductase [Rubrivivax sp.]